MSSETEEKPSFENLFINEYGDNDSKSKRPRRSATKRKITQESNSEDEEFVSISINKQKVLKTLKKLQNEVKTLKSQLKECLLENEALRENNVKLLVDNFKLKQSHPRDPIISEEKPMVFKTQTPKIKVPKKAPRREPTPEPEEQEIDMFEEHNEQDHFQEEDSLGNHDVQDQMDPEDDDDDDIDWNYSGSSIKKSNRKPRKRNYENLEESFPEPSEALNLQYYQKWDEAKELQEKMRVNAVDGGKSLREIINLQPGIKKDCLFVNKLAAMLFRPEVLARSSITGNTTNNLNFAKRNNVKLDPDKMIFLKGKFFVPGNS